MNKGWVFLSCFLAFLFIFSCSAGFQPGGLIVRWLTDFSHPNDTTDQVRDFWITSDGGTIGIGRTLNPDTGVWDIWVVKADVLGNEEWHQTFGGSQNDEGIGVFQTSYGDYLLVGNAQSLNMSGKSARNPSVGNWSIWIALLDDQGEIRWEAFYGGESEDRANAVKPHSTQNGFFYVMGSTRSSTGHLEATPEYGSADAWAFLGSLDFPGVVHLQGRYGGAADDAFYDLVEENGLIEFFVGVSASDFIPATGRFPPASNNFWFVLPNGQSLDAHDGRHYLFGGSDDESFTAGYWEDEGYYWLGGSTRSRDGDIPTTTHNRLPPTDEDGILLRFKVRWDTEPSIEWPLRVGGAGDEKVFGIIPLTQDEWLVGVQSYAQVGSHARRAGQYDNLLIGLTPQGAVRWNRPFPVENTLLQAMHGLSQSDDFYVYGDIFPSTSGTDERSLDDSDWFLAFTQWVR